MRPGEASATAKGAAAHRLIFDRVEVPFGDPDGDQRLQRDVADGADIEPTMVRYLQLRTTFFDQVVVDAVGAGIEQFVAIGAGYDGRCLRYGTADATWFEVDEAVTQADKRDRLERLGLLTASLVFAPIDLTIDSLGDVLDRAGHRADRPTLFTSEGVAGYLPVPAIAELLRSTRDRSAVGSRLAIEIPVAADSDAERSRQAEIRNTVADLGEPMPPAIPRQELLAFVDESGWEIERAVDPLGIDIVTSRKIPAFITARAS